MASVIKIKRSATSGNPPTNAQLLDGELAINTADGVLYSANSTAVFEVGANLSSLTVNAMAFPSEDGGSGQILKTYGNGTLFWTNEAGAAGFSAFTLYEFVASTNQTNFAGNDDNGESLGYKTGGGNIQVYLNGILLESGEDYTATNGANVILTQAASNNDLLQIHSYGIATTGNITIAANNNVGIGNASPAHTFSVNGNSFFQANVTVNNTLLDGDNRAFKVYYANGDVAWG
tara:strand:+ start:122 stop:820 length:699 start_codon:yes stop_codon:yes gene_type:complete